MKNALGFGLGTLGRDMMYGMVSMYLMFYLTDVLDLSTGALAAVTVVLVLMRIFDAVNDPFMGYVVDNTRTRWGKFKPWITIGACGWCIGTVLLFTDWGGARLAIHHAVHRGLPGVRGRLHDERYLLLRDDAVADP